VSAQHPIVDSLGFSPRWTVEVDPSLPPGDDWDCPVHRVPADSRLWPTVAIEAAQRASTSFVVRFRTEGGKEWVGYFAKRDGGPTGVYGCPNPRWALVIADEYAYLVDVEEPASFPDPSFNRMFHREIHAAHIPGRESLLVWSWLRAVGVGPDGVTWDAQLFAMHERGVELLQLTNDQVAFRVQRRDGEERVVIAPESGETLSVEPLPDGTVRLADSFTTLASERPPSIRTIAFAELPGSLIDLDFTPEGQWVAIAGSRRGKVISFAGREIVLPRQFSFPQIRAIEEDTALVYAARSRADESNAIVMTVTGKILAEFPMGDGIQDVLVSPAAFVALYFDEGVFGNVWPGWEGVAVFEPSGELRFGYRSRLGDQAVDVADAYAGCWTEHGSVLFTPYTEFPLVELNIEDGTQEVRTSPEPLHGAGAITSIGDEVYLHAPFQSKTTIWRWNPGSSPEAVAGFGSVLRGLRGGRLLGFRNRECVVVSVGR
jgi:hypothetical protein